MWRQAPSYSITIEPQPSHTHTQAIRETDAPERHQLSLLSLPKGPEEESLDWAACAAWVYDMLFERLKQASVRRDEHGRPVPGANGEWLVQDEELVCRRFEGYLVESGRLEVQGAPEGGWQEGRGGDALHGGLTELGSYRCVVARVLLDRC